MTIHHPGRHEDPCEQMLALTRETAQTLRACERHPDDVEAGLRLDELLDKLADWRDRLRTGRWEHLIDGTAAEGVSTNGHPTKPIHHWMRRKSCPK